MLPEVHAVPLDGGTGLTFTKMSASYGTLVNVSDPDTLAL
jgi:hypothetical protein